MHGEFAVGEVLGKTFSTLFRNIAPFGILAAIVYSPSLLVQLGSAPSEVAGSEGQGGELWLALLEALLAQVLTAAVVYGTVQDLRGQEVGLGGIVGRGFATVLPVIVVAIIYTIMIALGSALLIVPGLIVITVFWVVIPVTVVERPGIFAAFSRSAELTGGNRWPIFGLLMLVVVLTIVITLVPGFVLAVFGGTVLIFGTWLLSALIATFNAVLVAVSYHDLRVAKEGIDSRQLAAVFD